MRALIIDDNEEITDMMSQYLTLKGYDCTISNDGAKGLDQILSKNHDFVLLDIAMPEFSGIDIVKSLEKKGKLKENKIIVLTASSITDEDMGDLLKRGVIATMKKPVDLSQLLEVIKYCTEIPN